MPVKTFLILLGLVIAASGLTIAAAFAFQISFVWLGLLAAFAAVLVRRWV